MHILSQSEGSGVPTWALGVVAILTWLGTTGIEAWKKYAASKQRGREYDDEQHLSGYMLFIEQLKERIAVLEAKIDNLINEHKDCIEQSAELRAENASLKKHVEMMQSEVDGLREWRRSVDAGENDPQAGG